MIEDRAFFREEMRTALRTGVASTSRVFVELRGATLPALRFREPCLEEIGKTGGVVGEGVLEVENGEAWRLHAVGRMYLQPIPVLPSRQGIIALNNVFSGSLDVPSCDFEDRERGDDRSKQHGHPPSVGGERTHHRI